MSSLIPSLKYSCSAIATDIVERKNGNRGSAAGFPIAAARRSLGELAIKRAGLGRRFDAKVSLERLAATLILANHRITRALGGIEPHQVAVRRLQCRVQCQQVLAELDPFAGVAFIGMVAKELDQRLDGAIMQAPALGPHPVLEGLFGEGKAVKEFTAIERRRLFQGFDRSFREGPVECRRVDFHIGRIEEQVFALGLDPRHVRSRDQPSRPGQCLAQATPRLGLAAVRPEQRRDLFARMRQTGLQRQDGEKGRGLPGRELDRLSTIEADLEPSQHIHLQFHIPGQRLPRRVPENRWCHSLIDRGGQKKTPEYAFLTPLSPALSRSRDAIRLIFCVIR